MHVDCTRRGCRLELLCGSVWRPEMCGVLLLFYFFFFIITHCSGCDDYVLWESDVSFLFLFFHLLL